MRKGRVHESVTTVVHNDPMRAFISSVINGMSEYRDAAAEALRTLDLDVRRAEELPASDETPQQACLREVRSSDLVVLLLGSRYGAPQDGGLSATHEEFREAKSSKPVLVFVQDVEDRDPLQSAFVEEAQAWTGGFYTGHFRSPGDLAREVTRSVNRYLVSTAAGSVDADEVLARAIGRSEQRILARAQPTLTVCVAGAPTAQVISPSELEDAGLASTVQQDAFFGETPVLDISQATPVRIEGDRLLLQQEAGAVVLDQAGTIRIDAPATEQRVEHFGGAPLNHVILSHRIEQALRFCGQLLGRIDPTHQLTHICPVARLHDADYVGWQDPAASDLSLTGVRGAPSYLTPATRPRRALTMDAEQIASDLATLLRRGS